MEQTNDTRKNMDKSQKHYAEQKRPDKKKVYNGKKLKTSL